MKGKKFNAAEKHFQEKELIWTRKLRKLEADYNIECSKVRERDIEILKLKDLLNDSNNIIKAISERLNMTPDEVRRIKTLDSTMDMLMLFKNNIY